MIYVNIFYVEFSLVSMARNFIKNINKERGVTNWGLLKKNFIQWCNVSSVSLNVNNYLTITLEQQEVKGVSTLLFGSSSQ